MRSLGISWAILLTMPAPWPPLDPAAPLEALKSTKDPAPPPDTTTPRPPATTWRPANCQGIALILQGGGALGSYQAGVYQALHEAGLEPDWVAGISIGSINGAIIAGNPPERRLERLREFWETITARDFCFRSIARFAACGIKQQVSIQECHADKAPPG